jgi:hypothetical protein
MKGAEDGRGMRVERGQMEGDESKKGQTKRRKKEGFGKTGLNVPYLSSKD